MLMLSGVPEVLVPMPRLWGSLLCSSVFIRDATVAKKGMLPVLLTHDAAAIRA